MENDKIYRLRRGLLIAVADYVNPVGLDYVLNHPEIPANTDPADALDQWKGLIARGFLHAVPGTSEEFVTITALGKKQLPEAAPEGRAVYVWGRGAL